MPEKVVAWSCSFKCGERVKTKRTAMADHELRCFHNPQRRACQTCRHHEIADGEPWCGKVDDDGPLMRFDCVSWASKATNPGDR